MKINGSEDLRVQKTIDAIRSTFETMICEKDYSKITVKELCERARINKKTFYRYYPTLDDLLAEIQSDFSGGYIEKTANLHLPEDAEQIAREFCLFSAEQGDAYEKITCNGNYDSIRQQMINKVLGSRDEEGHGFPGLNSYESNLVLTFMHMTGIELYRQWVADGKGISAERLADIVGTLTTKGVNGLLKG